MWKVFSRRVLQFFAGIIAFCYIGGDVFAQSSPIVFTSNAGWCWYQDERAIINNDNLIFGIVPNNGNNVAVTYSLSTGTTSTFILHTNLQYDDHDAPAFMVRPDGRILAMFTKHGNDNYVRYRISTNPGDTSSWGAEQIFTVTSNYGATYSNVYRLSATGVTYDFYRGYNYQPNVLTSTNDGTTWSDAGHLVVTAAGTRPYAKYATDGTDKIWFTYTDGHPRDVPDNNIYVAYLQGSTIYNSYGTAIGSLPAGIAPPLGTKVYDAPADGSQRAWTSDMQIDSSGYPVLAYTTRLTNDDHRYRYSRFNGTTWTDYQIAYAGQCLYTAENDYTGLVTLNPSDPNTLYISTNADPVTGAALISSTDGQRHWEVFRGFTNDGGASWTWTPITANSTTNNIRPVVPTWDGQHTALLWLRGTYTSYTSYNMSAVGYIFDGANGIWSNAAGGDWTSTGNWQSGLIASGKLGIADFSTLDISGTVSVQLNGPRTLGFLVFADKNISTPGNWAIEPGSGGTITLENLGPTRPSITVQNQSASINVPLAGTQGLDIKGNGNVRLGAACTYSGGTTIYPGATLIISDGGALPPGGAVIDNYSLDFSSSGTIIFDGAISGNGYVSQRGEGTTVLTGNNSYTRETWVDWGVLRAASSNALGSANGGVIIQGDARVELAGGINLTKHFNLVGRDLFHGIGLAVHLANFSGNNVINGNITLTTGGYDYVIQSNAGSLTVNGDVFTMVDDTPEKYLYLQGAGDGQINGVVGSDYSPTRINLIKTGLGTWTLDQDIAYTGDTTVSGGVLAVKNFNADSASTAAVIVGPGAELYADSIMVNTLGVGPGGTVTIRPLSGGALVATTPVPEPSAVILLICGTAAIFVLRAMRA